MAQIKRLAKVAEGKAKNQAIDLNELVVGSLTIGGGSGTNLTKTELDLIISTQHAPMSDNQDVVAGAGLTGGGSGATTTINFATGDLSLLVGTDSVTVNKDVAGAIQLGAGGLFVGTDGATLEINTNALRIKDLGVSTAKLANLAVTDTKLANDVAVDANRAVSTNHIKDSAVNARTIAATVAGSGLTGGAGSALSVLFTPATKLTVTAGESYAANTTFLVRQAIDPETASRVYKATAATATNKKYLVVGLLLSTGALSAGNPATLLLNGLHTLGSSDTPFLSTDIGKEVYLTTAAGGFSLTPPTTVGAAQFRVGIVYSTTQILVDLKQLVSVVPEPQYDERLQYPAGLTSGTDITLPVNSRNGGAAQSYVAAEGRLQIYLNQQLKFQGIDWTVGASPTAQIKFNYALPLDAEVHFRIDALASGVLSGGGGGGGGGTLQDAYDAGFVINITSGIPLTINGPVSQKLLVINGDIEVTGVIDPKAVQLTGQASNPLDVGQAGIWVDMSGALMHEDGVAAATNISEVIAGVADGTAIEYIAKEYTNSTGVTITPYTPVYCPTAGHIAPADCGDLNKFKVVGITLGSIANGASGLVAVTGIVPGISATHNRYLYVGLTPGSLVDVGPTLGGYSAGFQVVRLGTVEGSNLILQIQHMGTL